MLAAEFFELVRRHGRNGGGSRKFFGPYVGPWHAQGLRGHVAENEVLEQQQLPRMGSEWGRELIESV